MIRQSLPENESLILRETINAIQQPSGEVVLLDQNHRWVGRLRHVTQFPRQTTISIFKIERRLRRRRKRVKGKKRKGLFPRPPSSVTQPAYTNQTPHGKRTGLWHSGGRGKTCDSKTAVDALERRVEAEPDRRRQDAGVEIPAAAADPAIRRTLDPDSPPYRLRLNTARRRPTLCACFVCATHARTLVVKVAAGKRPWPTSHRIARNFA